MGRSGGGDKNLGGDSVSKWTGVVAKCQVS